MPVQVTLRLPENLVEQAKQLGLATQRDVGVVLADVLEMAWPTFEELPTLLKFPKVSELPDAEVLKLANSTMTETQSQRMGELQTKGKAEGLNDPERYELMALLQVYQLALLRKSEALAEAVKRRLREPLNA